MHHTELLCLLQNARSHNAYNSLTGMLLFVPAKTQNIGNGRFIQVLEGSKENVIAIFERILADKRHHHITILNQGHLNVRNFAEWQMGFEYIEESNFKDESGYVKLNDAFFENFQPEKFNFALNFLKSFYELRTKIG